jgi:hypothetical protein
MAPNTITLLAGVLFLLIAVVGGGFTVERLQIPPVPRWSRIAAGVLGVAFLTGFLVSSLQSVQRTPGPTSVAQTEPASSPTREGSQTVELFRFAGPERSPDGLELVEFVATSGRGDPAVGDVITIRFTPFVAARSPSDDHEDTGQSAPRVVKPGEDIPTSASLVVDQKGPWSFWPCYEVSVGECPDEWQLHRVTVGD